MAGFLSADFHVVVTEKIKWNWPAPNLIKFIIMNVI